MYSVSFTGYRPEKMPFSHEQDPLCADLKKRIRDKIENSIKDGAINFFSGMARGADMWCAEIVLELKKTYPQINLSAVIPCSSQASGWTNEEIRRYQRILNECHRKLIISQNYTKNCMMKRNQMLVDICDVLIAVFDGQKGGTANTVKYAQAKGKKIITIEPIQS